MSETSQPTPWVEMATGSLPPYTQRVLVITTTGKMMLASLGFSGPKAHFTGKNMWRPDGGFPFPVDRVVAWMPIPRRSVRPVDATATVAA